MIKVIFNQVKKKKYCTSKLDYVYLVIVMSYICIAENDQLYLDTFIYSIYRQQEMSIYGKVYFKEFRYFFVSKSV
jgi:hypothetical protein